MNIDDTNDDSRAATWAENMKKFPFRVPSAKDFDLDGWDWKQDFIPDDLVRLYHYHQELFHDNMAQGIRNNERRPSIVFINQLKEEFDLDDERLEMFLFTGAQIAYDRELNAMTEEELAEHMEIQQAFSEMFDDKDGMGGVLDEIVEMVKKDSDERKALENIWKEGE